ncbi:MAG: glycosyltransferase family 4 protein [Lewinella sp.]|nr:glycosyltransferase family 4 protein [Lewinella sp.]
MEPTGYFQHLHPRVAMVTCVSPAVREVFTRLPGFRAEKAVVVSKGHDPAWYEGIEPLDLHSAFGIPAGRLVVGMVANARRMKGIEYLIEAIGRLAPGLGLHFLFVGQGLAEAVGQAPGQATSYADALTFAGFRSDVLELLAGVDISLLPSVKGEGLSKVLLESMFLGRPTIMTAIGGNRELGIHGQTAWIVPPRDASALAEALTILAQDPRLRRQLGAAGRAYVRAHFSARASAEALAAAYTKLLAEDTRY